MNMTIVEDSGPRCPIPDALGCAAKAAEELVRAGCTILTAFDNGRRIVLMIDRPPPRFISGHMKARHPNGIGGTATVYAAAFHGCQIEWLVDVARPAGDALAAR